MEIKYLWGFVVLAQTGNLMEATDLLYCSQSTLSKHINVMESELGVPLFDRTIRKVQISKFGQLLLPYAKPIGELQDKYTAILQSSLATDREILTLGSIPALAQYKITDVLVDLVSRGMGVALLTKQLALYVARPGIAIVDVSPCVSARISLCYLKGVELSDAAKHFVLCAGPQRANSGLLSKQETPTQQASED